MRRGFEFLADIKGKLRKEAKAPRRRASGSYGRGLRFESLESRQMLAVTPGDFNVDGAVDMADYTVYRDGLGTTYTAADYGVWTENFGTTTITLAGSSIDAGQSGATVVGSVATITKAGTYRITGTLTDGRIIVDTADAGAVKLIFDGVNITSSNNSPVTILNAAAVVVTLETGTQNFLTDGATYNNGAATEPDAALFSKSDLTINGTGALNVDANFGDGIASKDNLVIQSGTILVDAVDDGFRGTDSITIQGGSITVTSAGDSVKSTQGFVNVTGGTLNLTATKDGIQAETTLSIAGGGLTISALGRGLTSVGDITVSAGTLGIANSGAAGRGIDTDAIVSFTGGTTTVALSGATTLTASGSGFNAAYPTGVKADGSIGVSGTASVSVTGTTTATGARGLSADTGVTISAGNVTTNLAGGGAGYVNALGVRDAYRSAGIAADTTIMVTGGTVNLTASGSAGRGMTADGAITFAGGATTINLSGATLLTTSGSGNDPNYPTGVKADTTITVSAGSVTVTGTAAATGARGLSAGNSVNPTVGTINVTGGSVNVTLAGNGATYTNSTGVIDSYAAAALTADGALNIMGGTVTTSSSGTGGKGLKSDGTITIGSATTSPTLNITTTGARFLQSGTNYNHAKTIVATGAINVISGANTLNSSDDGIHSETSITISGGTNIITANSATQGVGEGVESPLINFTGGLTNIVASNDGINATYGTVAGGTNSNDNSNLNISGGIIIAYGRDAIDSNGNITITGGTVILDGPTAAPEEAIDYDGTFLINGGTLVAAGSNSNMTLGAGAASTQVNFFLKSSAALASTSLLHIRDAAGNEVVTYKPRNNVYYFHVSTPALAKNTTYSVYFGGTYTGGSFVGGLTDWGLLTGGTYNVAGATLKRTFTSSATATINPQTF